MVLTMSHTLNVFYTIPAHWGHLIKGEYVLLYTYKDKTVTICIQQQATALCGKCILLLYIYIYIYNVLNKNKWWDSFQAILLNTYLWDGWLPPRHSHCVEDTSWIF